MLINNWKIITIFHYFDKFNTRILVTKNYHTIISSVDADTQIDNKNKNSKRSWSNNLPFHNNLLQVFVCGNSPNPIDFLSEWFPLTECILENSQLCLRAIFLQRHQRRTTSNSILRTIDTWSRQSLPWIILKNSLLDQ